MINWELPHDNVACPHCGSTETHISLQLLGLVRYSCDGCKKVFAVNSGGDPAKAPAPVDHKASAPAR